MNGCGEDGPAGRRVALDQLHNPVSVCKSERDSLKEMGVHGYGT